MKPWSVRNQQALKELLKFYKSKPYEYPHEPRCPLCVINRKNYCVGCPWMTMTKKPCPSHTILDGKEVHRDWLLLKFSVIFSQTHFAKYYGNETYYLYRKLLSQRINEIERWIKYWEKENNVG